MSDLIKDKLNQILNEFFDVDQGEPIPLNKDDLKALYDRLSMIALEEYKVVVGKPTFDTHKGYEVAIIRMRIDVTSILYSDNRKKINILNKMMEHISKGLLKGKFRGVKTIMDEAYGYGTFNSINVGLNGKMIHDEYRKSTIHINLTARSNEGTNND